MSVDDGQAADARRRSRSSLRYDPPAKKHIINVIPFNDLPAGTLRELQSTLTNHPIRGDVHDGGDPVDGSFMSEKIDERLCGVSFPASWAIIASKVSDVTPVGWAFVITNNSLGRRRASVDTYVAPSARRIGLGTALINESFSVARRAACEDLCARPWNEAGRSFFVSHGFVRTVDPDSRVVHYVARLGTG